MGHATSRTRPSIVALETFARAPAIDVLCGGLDAAKTIPQHASKQILKGRIIGSPFHEALILWNFTSSMGRLINAGIQFL
jgi:hypothetical protein